MTYIHIGMISYSSVLPLEAVFAGRGALPHFGDGLPFLKSCNDALPF